MTRRDSTRPDGGLLELAFYILAFGLVLSGGLGLFSLGGRDVPFGSLRWRIGAMGTVFVSLALPVLGLLTASVVAAFHGRRRLLLALMVIQVAVALGLLASDLMFGLDAIQLRAITVPRSQGRFTVVSTQAIVASVVASLVSLSVALGSYRAFRRLSGGADRARAERPPLIV